MENLKPLGNHLLVERKKKETSKGGILIPETAQEKPKIGIVLAAGPGKRNEKGELEPLTVKVGNQVLFSSYAGTEIKEEELLILSEDDVLGILQS